MSLPIQEEETKRHKNVKETEQQKLVTCSDQPGCP